MDQEAKDRVVRIGAAMENLTEKYNQLSQAFIAYSLAHESLRAAVKDDPHPAIFTD